MFEPLVDRFHAALSNDVRVSPPKDSERRASAKRNGRAGASADAQGVLSQLPRTRPQRSSARRAAAREDATKDATKAATGSRAAGARSNGRSPDRSSKGPAGTPEKAASAPNASPKEAPKRTSAAKSAAARGTAGRRPSRTANRAKNGPASAEPAPRQGFECEGERNTGSVHPPGGVELVASAAEIVSELAKAGLSTGERLLKDVLSRLPLS